MKIWLDHFGFTWRVQRLDETVSLFRRGRAWLSRREAREFGRGRQVRVEWMFFDEFRWLGAEVSLFGGDAHRDLGFSLGLWVFAFYLTLENFLPARYGYPRHKWEHETGIRLHQDLLTLRLHYAGDDCFRCAGWQGLSWSCFLLDALLGPVQYSEQPVYKGRFELELPEGAYVIEGRLIEARWKRPRWPFPHILRRAHLDCAAGIPTPGKGESAWDQGDRQTFSFCCPAETIAEAVEKLREAVDLRRERYGGVGWRPRQPDEAGI